MSCPTAADPSAPDQSRALDAVRLDHVSLGYDVTWKRTSLVDRVVRNQRRDRTPYLALDDVSFSVAQGEVLGIIGANGSGKTTLLRVIAQVLDPTGGRLRIRGRTLALLDLLCGFHPELDGRENLYLYGAFLGLTRLDIDRRFQAIAEFADIGPFMEAPLSTYSAGMTLRLAFALLTSLDADVMVIDEILGVGDAEFQRKCERRFQERRATGATFIIASHDLLRIRELADRVLWLDGGRVQMNGTPPAVVAAYIESIT
jgi:ABC-type polysaccharide/polyol phosphate transport system ATPase subunit